MALAALYRKPEVGKRYVAATDTAHGVGQDYSVTVLLDPKWGIVADIMSNVLPPEALALESYKLLEKAHDVCGSWPLWAIEANEWGGITLQKALSLGYKNLYYRDEKHEKAGWLTNSSNRDCNDPFSLWGELIEAVNNRLVVVPNKQGLAQFYDVIRNAKKGGRIEAIEGGHDDYPIACAIAWQIRKYQQVSSPARASRPLRIQWG